MMLPKPRWNGSKCCADFWKDFATKIGEAMNLKITEVLEELNKLLEQFIFPNGRECPVCKTGTLGLKTSKFGAFIGCSNYPDCSYTAKLSYAGDASEEGAPPIDNEPKVLGGDPDSGLDVTLRNGPYGFYLQLGEETEEPKAKGKGMKKIKPKRFPLNKSTDPSTVTLEQALRFLSLPREVGLHPETKEMIKAGIGRFGPYLLYQEKFKSLKSDDVLEIGINRAVDILAGGSQGGAEKAYGKLKDLGELDGKKIELHKGRYGAYIKYGKTNVAVPKNMVAEALTDEEALDLVKKKLDK